MGGKGILTMLLLLRQALFGDLDVPLSGLEAFDPALSVMDRGSRGPDVEELDQILKLLQELLLLAIGVGKSLLVASLKILPVKGGQVARSAGGSLDGISVAVDALFGGARLGRLKLGPAALWFGKRGRSVCHGCVGEHTSRGAGSGRLHV